jgi:hypothetical protein
MCTAAHKTVTLSPACSNPSGPEQSMLHMHFSLFHATGSLPIILIRILSNSVFTHIRQCSGELNNQHNILTFMFFCTVHCDIIMQQKPMKCALFKLML